MSVCWKNQFHAGAMSECGNFRQIYHSFWKQEYKMAKLQGISMTEGTPWRHTLRFAFPVLAGSLLQQFYNTTDMIIVGRFAGEKSLSAVGTTGSFVFLFLAVALGISAGNGVVVSQHYGAGDEHGTRSNASLGLLLMGILAIVATIIGLAVSRPACKHLISVPPEIMEDTLLYFRIYALGLVFQYGYNAVSSILRAIGDSAATLYFLLISSLLNIVLDLLFVATFRWGVTGAAVATDIAQLGSFAAAYFYMHCKYPMFRFRLSDFRWDSAMAGDTVRVGLPIVLQLSIVAFGLTFIQRAVNGFGTAMTASFTVGHRMEMYLNLPCNAFHTTLATFTGQNYGAKKISRIRIGTRQTIRMSLILTLLISVLVWAFAKEIVSICGLGGEAGEYCLHHLRSVAIINVVLSIYVPLFGVFQGTGHSGVPAIVATCALGTRVLVTYLFRHSAFLGSSVIWWNGIFGFGMGFIISWSYYLFGNWMNGYTDGTKRKS